VVLVARECPPRVFLILLFLGIIPFIFFCWYFGYQRWDIAKWPPLCNLAGGILLAVVIWLAPPGRRASSSGLTCKSGACASRALENHHRQVIGPGRVELEFPKVS